MGQSHTSTLAFWLLTGDWQPQLDIRAACASGGALTCILEMPSLATSSLEHSTKPKPAESGFLSGPLRFATRALRMLPPAALTAASKCACSAADALRSDVSIPQASI